MPRPDAARAPYGDEHAVRAHACLMRVPTPAIVRRLLRFGIIGIMITLLHVIVAIGLIRAAHAAPALANAIAFAIATSASYIVNTFWSFSSGVTHQNAALSRGLAARLRDCLACLWLGRQARAELLDRHTRCGGDRPGAHLHSSPALDVSLGKR